ncbi:TonB-dependent receptor domain-containing protein [Arsenophonus sp. PmNCSU2021_1]|uniref:TonB-dependent receptor domain-containing protein n=1 Tax=Arsenophonus sp. PmNCSU2021_1 TaxID=3118989 RepID=UPI003FA5F850
MGSEFYQQQQQSNKQANHFPPATLRNIAVWLEDEITLNKLPITFSAGTRYTNYKNDNDKHGNNQDSEWTSRAAQSVLAQQIGWNSLPLMPRVIEPQH